MSIALRSKLLPSIARWSSCPSTRCLSSLEPLQTAVTRHSGDDSIVCLSVGGSTFYTLRSTMESNEVLAEHLGRASTTDTCLLEGKVFIDRDPKHFPFILQYLRDRIDAASVDASSLAALKNAFGGRQLPIPKDRQILQELYIEACYYKIPELQSTLCSTSTIAGFLRLFSKGNPFAEVSRLLAQLRAAALTLGTVGTVAITSQQDLTKLPIFAALRKDKED